MEHPSDYGDDIPGLPASQEESKTARELCLQLQCEQQTIVSLSETIRKQTETIRIQSETIKAQNEEIIRLRHQLHAASSPNSSSTPNSSTSPCHRQLRQWVRPEKEAELQPLLNRLELHLTTGSDCSGDMYLFDKKNYSLQVIYQVLRDIKPLLRVTTRAFLQYFTDHSNLGNTYNTVKSGFYYK